MNNIKNYMQKGGSHGLLLLTIPIGTFCLGTWQVKRRKWKIDLLEQLQHKVNLPAVPFPESLEKLEDMEYRKVLISGQFDHSRDIYIGPRSLITNNSSESSGLISSSSKSGYHVVTPFLLSNNSSILVNRGWIPRKEMNSPGRRQKQVEGPVQITAIVRKTEARQPFMPKNTNSSLFIYRDVPKMAEITDCLPVFVDAVDSVEGGPIGGQTRVTMRNEHMSYIITWYSLSLATACLWYRKFVLGKPLM